MAGLLRHTALFGVLDPHDAEFIGAQTHKQRFDRGQSMLQQDSRNHLLFILISGRAQVYRTDASGREVILELLQSGDHYGEMSLVDGLPSSASVRAETDCDVLTVDGSAFAQCLAQRPELALQLLSCLVHRLRGAYRTIASLAHEDIADRVLRRLHALSGVQDGRRLVRERLSRQDLAKMVGASREMISRTMKDLETRGQLQILPDGSLHLCGEDPLPTTGD